MNIKNAVHNTLAITFIMLLFIFAFTWIVFEFQGSTESLKDTWAIFSSLFGGITTLVAAYVALLIYSGWKRIEYFKAIQSLYNEGVISLLICSKQLNRIKRQLSIIEMQKDKAKINNLDLTEKEKQCLTRDLIETTKDVMINVQDSAFDVCVKIAMDYTKPLNSDPDLMFIFNKLNSIKNLVHKITNNKDINDNNIKEIAQFIDSFNIEMDKKCMKGI